MIDQLVAATATHTTQTHETNIHTLSGIRSYNASDRTAANLRHRQHGHRDRPSF
jgi:hypothetical protein